MESGSSCPFSYFKCNLFCDVRSSFSAPLYSFEVFTGNYFFIRVYKWCCVHLYLTVGMMGERSSQLNVDVKVSEYKVIRVYKWGCVYLHLTVGMMEEKSSQLNVDVKMSSVTVALCCLVIPFNSIQFTYCFKAALQKITRL